MGDVIEEKQINTTSYLLIKKDKKIFFCALGFMKTKWILFLFSFLYSYDFLDMKNKEFYLYTDVDVDVAEPRQTNDIIICSVEFKTRSARFEFIFV